MYKEKYSWNVHPYNIAVITKESRKLRKVQKFVHSYKWHTL